MLGVEEAAPIRLLGDSFGGFLEAFGLHRVLGDGRVVGFDGRRQHKL